MIRHCSMNPSTCPVGTVTFAVSKKMLDHAYIRSQPHLPHARGVMSTVYLQLGQCGNQLGLAFWEEASTPKWSSAYNTSHSYGDSKRLASNKPPPPWTASSRPLPPGSGGRVSSSSSVSSKPDTSRGKPPSSFSVSGAGGKKASSDSVTANPLPLGTRGRATPASSYPTVIPFTLTDGSVPCVMVDTEPKVIRRCLDVKHGSVLAHRLPKECCVWDKAGRGNNWAYGYHGSGTSERGLVERVREAIRKVVERCDRFSGFVVFHSISGGTGSGLGSALLECLRADYPLPYIITATVTPFASGETPLQHLNSLLCLSWLQSFTDAVLLFGNDGVMEQTHKQLSRSEGASGGRVGDKDSVCVEDMNRHISSVLCNTLMPIWQMKQKSPNLSFQQGWEMIRSLCPDPASKLLTANHVQSTRPAHTWHQTTGLLLQQGSSNLWRGTAAAGKAKTASLACIVRGSPSTLEHFAPELGQLETKLKKAYNTVSWNPFPVDYWASYEPTMGHTKLATVLANSSAVLDYVETTYDRASSMFREGAYLHWYERYGCERDTFKQAFESVQGVIDTYRGI